MSEKSKSKIKTDLKKLSRRIFRSHDAPEQSAAHAPNPESTASSIGEHDTTGLSNPTSAAELFAPLEPKASSASPIVAGALSTPGAPAGFLDPAHVDFLPTTQESKHNTHIDALESVPDSNRSYTQFLGRPGFQRFFKFLETGAGVFGPLQSVMSELSACVGDFDQAARNSEAYKTLLTELNSLLGDLSGYLEVSIPTEMTPRLQDTINALEEEIACAKQKQARDRALGSTRAAEDVDDIMNHYRTMQQILARLALHAGMSTLETATEQAINARISVLPNSWAAVYKSASSEGLHRRSCTPNTRVDVLSQLHSWAYNDQARTVYWLNGMAGTGKTTIAYSFCDELEKTCKLAASFFCSRQLPECRDANNIFPSIAYQLSLYSPPFRHALSEQLKVKPAAHNQPMSEQFRDLIAEPLRRIKKKFLASRVILIDALDECDDKESIERLLSAILISAHGLPVKFVVTSRPEAKILDRMRREESEKESARTELHLHDLKEDVVQRDIRTYLTQELKRVNMSDVQLNSLVRRCGTLFIYAATIVRYIGDDDYLMADEILTELLASTKPDADGSEQDIDQLYSLILKAAFENPRSRPDSRQRMKKILCTALCAQEPLSIDAIASLLDLKYAKLVTVALRPLYSVLHVDEATGLVTTLHESFPSYMRDPERSHDFYCNARAHHNIFARQCFKLIEGINPPFNICRLQSSYALDDEVPGLTEKIREYIPESLFYACRHWAGHLSLAEPSPELMSHMDRLVSTWLLVWMEVMNLKKCMSDAGKGLVQALRWGQIVQCSDSTRDMIQDAVQFLPMFSAGAGSRSTPHIYLSGLAHWPQHRPISRAYKKDMNGLTQITGTAMNSPWLSLLCTIDAQSAIHCVAYSQDGSRIVSGCRDYTVRIWDAYTAQQIGQPLEGHTGWVLSVAYSSDCTHITSGSHDCTLRIWDAHTGQQIGQPLQGHTDYVTSVAYSPNSRYIVSGSDDRTLRIWNAHTGQQIGQALLGHTCSVTSVVYSLDGTRLASGSSDRTVRVWDAYTGQQIGQPLQGHTSSVTSVSSSPDGIHIASGSSDSTVRIWDARSGMQIGQPLQGHARDVTSVAYSPDGMRIVSGSNDYTLCIWNPFTGQQIGHPLRGHTSWVFAVAYSPNGAHVVSGSEDHTVRIWDAQIDPYLEQPSQGHTDQVLSVAYSPNGAHIVSGSGDRTVRIWDAHLGQQIGQPLVGHSGSVWSVSCSPSSTHVASGSHDRAVRLWPADTNQKAENPLHGHSDTIWSVAYSPNGAHLASGSSDRTVRIWDVHLGQQIGQPLQGHTGWVYSVAYSPDGTCIVSGSDDCTVRIWDVHTGQQRSQPLLGHTGSVMSVVYSSDGSRMVSGSDDHTVRIWDAQSGQQIGRPLEGHTSWVLSVSYSPDSMHIVSGSRDHSIRIWDAHFGKQIGEPLQGHTDSVMSVAYSPDGTRIISGSGDGTVRVWDHKTFLDSYNGRLEYQTPVRNWSLKDNGWIMLGSDAHLLWIPGPLRPSVLHPHNLMSLSSKGFISLDFSDAHLGDRWAQCFQRPDAVSIT